MSTEPARLHWLDERLAIAAGLSTGDLGRFAGDGGRTIIDLREDDEASVGGMIFAAGAARAAALGIGYQRVPMSHRAPAERSVETGRALLCDVSGRILLHCTDGARAAALALIHLGCDRGVALGDCYARAELLRVRCGGVGRLLEFWVGYVLGHAEDRVMGIGRRPAAARGATLAGAGA
jgi:uncharacterized protein (TIGR01244 family)